MEAITGRGRGLAMVTLVTGGVQVLAGVALYLAGVYFAPWSGPVSLFVLLVGVVAGTRWYAARYLPGRAPFQRLVGVGITISVGSGLMYAIYNLVSIAFFYPAFLDEMARATRTVPQDGAGVPALTASMVALANLVRMSVVGSVLSVLTYPFQRAR